MPDTTRRTSTGDLVTVTFVIAGIGNVRKGVKCNLDFVGCIPEAVKQCIGFRTSMVFTSVKAVGDMELVFTRSVSKSKHGDLRLFTTALNGLVALVLGHRLPLALRRHDS